MSKRWLRCLSLALIMLVMLTTTVVAEVDFSSELYNELAQGQNKAPYIKLPDYKRIELDNKLVIYLVEDHSLPTVEITGYIEGGLRQESKKAAGISDFMLEMMNTGTQNFKQQELAQHKEVQGIDFDFSVKKDYYKLSGSALTTDSQELISLAADILRNPNFDAAYYDRIKEETKQNLAQTQTRQDALLDMYFTKQIYQDHPYSFASNYKLRQQSLENITPKTLKKFYKQNIAPNNLVLGVVGDINTKKLEKLLKDEFSDWEERDIKLEQTAVQRKEKQNNSVIVVNKPDATQAKIRMGYNFFAAGFEDRVAFKMANRIYGGGAFSSRLMKNLRSEKGFVYNINAAQNSHQLGGSYYINTEVEPTKTYQAITAIKEEMAVIKKEKEPLSTKELEENINLYNALLPKSYQNKVDILDQMIYNSEIRGRKVDYVNQFVKQYNNLNAPKVQQVFANYTYPERFSVVIVANKDQVVSNLEDNGLSVEVIETK
ncbi:MAG: M16 family metallopeptidase [Bacillota bacterium]